MGDINQLLYLKHYMPKVNGPILEIGSKDYGSTSSYRDYYVSNEEIRLPLQTSLLPGRALGQQ